MNMRANNRRRMRGAVERKGIEPVREAERHGSPRWVFALWFSANLQYSALAVGVTATAFFGLGLIPAALALLAGHAIGCVFLGATAGMGPGTGTPQLVQARAPFGHSGNTLPVVLNLLLAIGYFAVNTVLASYVAVALFHTTFLSSLLAVLAMVTAIALVGHDLVHRVSQLVSPVMGAMFVLLTWFAFARAHLDVAGRVGAVPGGTAGAVMLTVTIGAARTFGWCTAASDFTRYLPRAVPTRRVRLAAGLGAGVSGLWMYLTGAAVGTFVSPVSPADLVTRTAPAWLGGAALAALLIASVFASTVDVYAASLDLLVAGVRLRRWQAAAVVGALGGVAGWAAGRHESAVFEDFQNFLVAMSYWLGPWIAIVLVDYFLVRHTRLDVELLYDPGHRVGPGLPALVFGVLVAVAFMRNPVFVGPAAGAFPEIGDIAYWVGGVAAGCLYWWLSRRFPRPAPGRAER